MSCKCQECGKQYKVDVNVSDEVWDDISDGKNLLCGSCIFMKIEEIDFYDVFELTNKYIVAKTHDGVEVRTNDTVWVKGSTGYHTARVLESSTSYELFGPIPVSQSFSSEEAIKDYFEKDND